MRSVQNQLKCFVLQPSFLLAGLKVFKACWVWLWTLTLAGDLRVEKAEIDTQLSLLVLFLLGHRFSDIDSAAPKHIQKHAPFGALAVCESYDRFVLTCEQVNHRVVGRDFALKKALLSFFAAGDTRSQSLDYSDGFI